MKRSLLTAAVVAALACAPATRAETSNPDQNATQTLDRVIVFGSVPTPMPANTDQRSGDALAGRSAVVSDSARLLDGIPGVSVQSGGGISGLAAIHGLTGDRNRVQVDGMDFIAACPNHMNPPLSYIDPTQVGEITVHAGITPVSAGGDSIGGSIQVKSAPPFARAGHGWSTSGELSARLHSQGDARRTSGSAKLANEAVSFGVAASLSRAGNYHAGGDFRSFSASGREGHTLDRDEVASSAYEVRNQSATIAFRTDTHLFTASYVQQDIPLQGYPNQRMDMTANDERRWQLAWQASEEWGALEARVWRERLRHAMGFGPDRQYWYGMQSMQPGTADYTVACAPLGPMCAGDMPMETESRTTAATLLMSLQLRDQDLLRFGGEWQHYRLDDGWPPSGGAMWPNRFWNIREGRRHRASVFAEFEGRLSSRWMLLLGARYTRVTTNTGEVQGYDIDPTPPGSWAMTQADAAAFNARRRDQRDSMSDVTGLLRWTPHQRLDVELGYAYKSRAPNLYERYAWSTWSMAAVMNNIAGDGNGYVGDVNLKPERAQTWAMTMAWHAPGNPKDWQLRVTPWHTRVEDYIDAVALTSTGSNQFSVLRYANQSVRLLGVDFLAETKLTEGPSGQWRLKGSGNWQRAENRDTGQPLYNSMPPNARLTLSHRLGGWEGDIELEGASAKTHVSTVRNEIPTQGYGLMHLRGSYQWPHWRVDAGVENLFNRLYALPTGGAYVAQGRTMGINAIPHGIAVPGAGRGYYLSLKLDY